MKFLNLRIWEYGVKLYEQTLLNSLKWFWPMKNQWNGLSCEKRNPNKDDFYKNAQKHALDLLDSKKTNFFACQTEGDFTLIKNLKFRT